MTDEAKAPWNSTCEPQYQRSLELARENGLTTLGLMTNQAWTDDPRHLLFTLARYKFVAKMLTGRNRVLEIGCADAFGTRLVVQEVKHLTASDFDQTFVTDVLRRMDQRWQFDCKQHDLLAGSFPGTFDAAYALDVIEHIDAEQEALFVGNLVRSLTPEGVLILGSPSLQSQAYASLPSKAGHINCKTGQTMRTLLEKFFHNVFVFSMNDEVVHTGYFPMAHYVLGIGCTRKTLGESIVIGQGYTGTGDSSLDLTIAIPCLNEEKNICATLDTVVAAMSELPYSYEILVIDDGSTDNTAKQVHQYCETHKELPIHLHRNARNRGLAYSYVDGAFLGRGKYYRMVCGDNVEPRQTLMAVFRELGKADLIIPYHEHVSGKSPFRRMLSQTYSFLVNTFSGYEIHYYNGLALTLRYNVMRWGPYSFGFGFQAELITRLLDEGATYKEIPVVATHEDKAGLTSVLNWRNFCSVGHTLLEVLLRRIRKHALKG
jgi:2-polyprenyl-3-methyl-5-hydroxy-6-metoxy-1,4-benzoquinol methylase